MFPRVEVEGGARERGRQYGETARDRVNRSVDIYHEVFAHYAGWDWERVRGEAERYVAPVTAFEPRYLEEIRGLAEGAGLDEFDVLAINVRTEIIFAATARGHRTAECTSFAVVPTRAAEGTLLIGQNWDWIPETVDTTVILEARQDDGPDFVTVVEAGLLAKVGMNSSGVAVGANALVSAADVGTPGVPFHVLLRALHDADNLADGMRALGRMERSSSANYLLAHEDGLAVDIEAAPGGVGELFPGYPSDGVILHANHFINPGFRGCDVGLVAMPDSVVRFMRGRQLVADRSGPLDRAFFEALLADHAGYPLSVCSHPDPRVPAVERTMSVAAVIMEPATRRLWITDGNPCGAPFELLDYGAVLTKPTPLRAVVG
jgi:isopenicillin-N N-acyltransferase like protein